MIQGARFQLSKGRHKILLQVILCFLYVAGEHIRRSTPLSSKSTHSLSLAPRFPSSIPQRPTSTLYKLYRVEVRRYTRKQRSNRIVTKPEGALDYCWGSFALLFCLPDAMSCGRLASTWTPDDSRGRASTTFEDLSRKLLPPIRRSSRLFREGGSVSESEIKNSTDVHVNSSLTFPPYRWYCSQLRSKPPKE